MAVLARSLPTRTLMKPTSIVAVVIGFLSVCAAVGAIMLSGTKTGVVLALLATLGPIVLYGVLAVPLVFPFALFVLLVPFDNLLALSSVGTLTKLVAIACGAAFILWLLRTRRYVLPTRAVAVWGGFMLLQIVSLVWAIDPALSLQRLATPLELYTLYAAASFMPVNERVLRTLIVAAIGGAVIAGLYGAYVFHSGVDVSNNGRLFLANDETLIDPNHFAAALIAPFALALSALASTRSRVIGTLAAVAVACIALGIAVAGSRGGILAVAVAFLYLCIRSRRRLAICAIGVAGLALALAMHGSALSRFSNATSSGGAGRFDIWKVGLTAFSSHWMIGAGFGNFPIAFDRAFLSVSEGYYTHWHRVSHNILVGTAVELGVIGLVVLLIAWWFQLRTADTIAPTHPLYWMRTGLEAGVCGLFFAGLFLDILTQKYLWLAFILLALVRNATRGGPAPALRSEVPDFENDLPAVLPSRRQ